MKKLSKTPIGRSVTCLTEQRSRNQSLQNLPGPKIADRNVGGRHDLIACPTSCRSIRFQEGEFEEV
jgi:hypothetical protein